MDSETTGTDTVSSEPPQRLVNVLGWTLAVGLTMLLGWGVWAALGLVLG